MVGIVMRKAWPCCAAPDLPTWSRGRALTLCYGPAVDAAWLSEFPAARKHDLIALLGGRERAYFAYHRALRRPARATLVEPDTDLCIEAPPGSGNTFFTAGFAMANPTLRLAHHHHVAAQVRRAHRLGVPTLLIVREPSSCVLSRAVSWRHPAVIGPAYREWMSFWRRARTLLGQTVVVDFETVTKRPAAVIDVLNQRFDANYSTTFPSSDRVFAAMDRARAAAFPTFSSETGINPNRPDGRKEELKAWLRPLTEAHRLARPTRRLYRRVLRAVPPLSL